MGQVQVGEELLGADGRPVLVVAATEVMTGRPCYEVVFDDQTSIVADAEHQWVTTTRADRRLAYAAAGRTPSGDPARADYRAPVSVRTTAEIAASLRRK